MEALETVVGYWEDALAAYQPRNGMNHQLTTAEEAAFVKMLENILETAYNLQEESEHMFIYQESILNKSKRKTLSVNFIGINELDGHNGASSSYKTPLLSVSSVDQVKNRQSHRTHQKNIYCEKKPTFFSGFICVCSRYNRRFTRL